MAGGSENLFLGTNSGALNTAGVGNTGVGNYTLTQITEFSNNSTATGDHCLENCHSSGNTGYGAYVYQLLGDGANNNATGQGAGSALTGGANNNFHGVNAANTQTSGDNNGAYGYNIQLDNTTGSNQANFHGILKCADTVTAKAIVFQGNIDTVSTNIWGKPQCSNNSVLTDASTITPDFSLSNDYSVVLGGNRTLGVPSNIPITPAIQKGTITVRQDITGTRTLQYAWCYVFAGGTAPALTTTKAAMDQLYYQVNSYSTSPVTVTIATPGVMTWANHGFVTGMRIQLTTTGALPTGLAANTTYWVTVIDANTFKLSSSLANVGTATFIATSGSQSGVHTATNISITISSGIGIA